MCLFCLHICDCMCEVPMETRRGDKIPWNWESQTVGSCVIGCWELSPGPLEEQPGLFTMEHRPRPSFYPLSHSLHSFRKSCRVFESQPQVGRQAQNNTKRKTSRIGQVGILAWVSGVTLEGPGSCGGEDIPMGEFCGSSLCPSARTAAERREQSGVEGGGKEMKKK